MPQPNMSLKQSRKRAGLSTTELAAKAGVTQGAISHIETGRRLGSDETLRKLADALGIEVAQIGGRAA